jgi:hypothetical protein
VAKKKSASTSTTTEMDTARGAKAYALATAHQAQVEPRLPAGTLAELAADLTTLGEAPAVAQASSTTQAPSLAGALAVAANLVSAVHAALHGAGVKPSVRKAYGVAASTPAKEATAVRAAAEKIVAAASGDPTGALALGILPADVAALEAAMVALTAAEAAAHGGGEAAGPTAKEKRAAVKRMGEATARIAGAGVLAFAQDAGVRAEFAGLVGK